MSNIKDNSQTVFAEENKDNLKYCTLFTRPKWHRGIFCFAQR